MRDGLDGFDIECNQPVGGNLKARGPFGRERNIKPACLLQGGPTIGPDQFILDIHHPASSSSSQSRITQVSLAVIETLSSLPQAYSAEHHYRTNYTSLLLYTHPAAPPTLQYHHISLVHSQPQSWPDHKALSLGIQDNILIRPHPRPEAQLLLEIISPELEGHLLDNNVNINYQKKTVTSIYDDQQELLNDIKTSKQNHKT
ncbi:hypothetical protein E4T38_01822 [Aureobasidium subglaciale]|nr:hypothetical protein E4T38_01822 [Aureobasidium subglaciale]KAI5229260.1 hypothetical protein E4T40_01658 [Aureobasidium subglaciale]KAI5233000.1 hypothetical protein E4T41_01820 [Aureobasidium subglaciale]KAI5266231.1 hypothetical protein E4T46_01655 [Aureobasidium subglaciale]